MVDKSGCAAFEISGTRKQNPEKTEIDRKKDMTADICKLKLKNNVLSGLHNGLSYTLLNFELVILEQQNSIKPVLLPESVRQ